MVGGQPRAGPDRSPVGGPFPNISSFNVTSLNSMLIYILDIVLYSIAVIFKCVVPIFNGVGTLPRNNARWRLIGIGGD